MRGVHQLQQASIAHVTEIRSRVSALKARGVKLVLESGAGVPPPSAMVSSMCLEVGIVLVGGLEEDEAAELCAAAGISMTGHSGVDSYYQ